MFTKVTIKIFFTACYNNPVGVSSASIIPDSQMTASSQSSVRYQSAYGRLQGVRGGGWCSLSPNRNDEWLQVDLGESIQACGLATQGEANEVNEWVTAFKLSYSSDGKSWKTCKDKNGKELVRCYLKVQVRRKKLFLFSADSDFMSSLLRGFFSGFSGFPPSTKTNIPNSNSTWKQWTKSHLVEVPLLNL